MEKGDIVTIYEDPFTNKEAEGKAVLLECIAYDKFSEMERWKVSFEEDENGMVVERWITI